MPIGGAQYCEADLGGPGGDRLCAHCSAQRREAHIDKVKGLIARRKLGPESLAMLTLTLVNVPTITKDTWREMGARFHTFRGAAVGAELDPGRGDAQGLAALERRPLDLAARS